MAASLAEYQEVLRDESLVDVSKLRDWAVHGVPQEVRGEVWKYLLRVADPDLSREAERQQQMERDYALYEKENQEFGRLVKFEVEKYRPQEELFRDPETRRMFRNVIASYLNQHDQQFAPQMVYFCGPLIAALKMRQARPLAMQPHCSDAELYAMFRRLMILADKAGPLRKRVGKFMSLFRSLLPDLYQHFEDEELDASEWAVSWLQYFLSRELRLDCLLPLWDAYFAQDDCFDLHPFVCLALLDKCKEDLEELEHSELHAYMLCLPPVDVNEILVNADNFKAIAEGII